MNADKMDSLIPATNHEATGHSVEPKAEEIAREAVEKLDELQLLIPFSRGRPYDETKALVYDIILSALRQNREGKEQEGERADAQNTDAEGAATLQGFEATLRDLIERWEARLYRYHSKKHRASGTNIVNQGGKIKGTMECINDVRNELTRIASQTSSLATPPPDSVSPPPGEKSSAVPEGKGSEQIHNEIQDALAKARLTREYEQEGRELEASASASPEALPTRGEGQDSANAGDADAVEFQAHEETGNVSYKILRRVYKKKWTDTMPDKDHRREQDFLRGYHFAIGEFLIDLDDAEKNEPLTSSGGNAATGIRAPAEGESLPPSASLYPDVEKALQLACEWSAKFPLRGEITSVSDEDVAASQDVYAACSAALASRQNKEEGQG
jgi:hypothetical protein